LTKEEPEISHRLWRNNLRSRRFNFGAWRRLKQGVKKRRAAGTRKDFQGREGDPRRQAVQGRLWDAHKHSGIDHCSATLRHVMMSVKESLELHRPCGCIQYIDGEGRRGWNRTGNLTRKSPRYGRWVGKSRLAGLRFIYIVGSLHFGRPYLLLL
jgi:hypothetical protein